METTNETRKIHTRENWDELINAMHSGAVIEIDEEVFDYFLEVLPPAYMGRVVTLPCGETRRVAFGFAEGYEPITAFWSAGGRNFCQRTKEMNRC
jgi:hypothetical protein